MPRPSYTMPWLVLLVMLASAMPAVAAADARETKARARYAAGKYQEAVEIFADLFAEKGDPVYLRNIGRCYQMMEKPDDAIRSFRQYLQKSKKLSAAEQHEIEGYIQEMQDLKNAQASQAPSAGTAERPLAEAPVTPAPEVAAPAPDRANITSLPTPAASPTPVTLVSADPSHSERTPVYGRWWFWTGIGVLLAGAAVGVTLALSSRSAPGECLGQTACFVVRGQ